MSPIFRCVGPTMRLKIVTICARSPTMLATIAQVRQAPSVLNIFPEIKWGFYPYQLSQIETSLSPEE